MFKRKKINQFIPGVKTSFINIYPDKVTAYSAVNQSLNNYLHKELRIWLKQKKIKKQSESSAKGSSSQSVNSADKLFKDYFKKNARDIVEACFVKKVKEYHGDIDSDSFDEAFVQECVVALHEKKCGLFYQGSSTLVFYQDGRYIRALKPETGPEYQSGLNAEANKNLRIIGTENSFKKRRVEKINRFKIYAPHRYAPRMIDIKESQIIWGNQQGVLIVYEKEEGEPVGKEIYHVLDELIKETKPKKESNSISSLRHNVNLGSAISKLQDVVSRTDGLRSCQLYIINEKEKQVIKSDLKTYTCDPIDSALLDSEKSREILVETILSTNYHFKAFFKGLGRIFLANLGIAILFILITVICFIAGAIIYSPTFFVCGVLAFIVGLGVIAYRSDKSIDRLLEETKPTKEYEKEILTELGADRIADFALNKLTELESYIAIENKEDPLLSPDKVSDQGANQLECDEKSKFERQDKIKLSQEADQDKEKRKKIFFTKIVKKIKNLINKNGSENKKPYDSLDPKPGILNTNPFIEEEALESSPEQKKGKRFVLSFFHEKSDKSKRTKDQKSSFAHREKNTEQDTMKKHKKNFSASGFFKEKIGTILVKEVFSRGLGKVALLL